jgi:hypothetical protein
MTKNVKRLIAGGALLAFGFLGLGGCFGGHEGCPTVYSCGFHDEPS